MDCIAHRGFAGAAAENTLGAVREAAGVADRVEVDVRRCGSGDLVAVHDATVDRVTEATGPVRARSASELARLDVLGSGEGIPTLTDVLDAIPADVGVVLDLKEAGLAPALADPLAGRDVDALVSAFDREILATVVETCGLPVAPLFASDPDAHLAAAGELGAAAVHPHWELCDAAFVERAHAAGLAVNAWTIADAGAAEAARAAGVDGLIVDHSRFCGAADRE